MLAVKVNKSLKRIISSKKKVLEIQHVIASKRIRDKTITPNKKHSKLMEDSNANRSYESSLQKLNFIESCISENEFTVINLLREDRYEHLSMKEIYDELFIDFKRALTVTPNHYQRMGKTG